jgi:hypothetical protein
MPGATPEQLLLFVQSIKGAPASVLFALGITGRYMSNEELQMWTRCGPVQIRLALRTLMRLGWLQARTSRGPWAIKKERRLPVVFSLPEGIDFKSTSSSSDSLNSLYREELLPGDRSDRLLRLPTIKRTPGSFNPGVRQLAGSAAVNDAPGYLAPYHMRAIRLSRRRN